MSEMVKVYFESNSHAEMVAVFSDETIYAACAPVLEADASISRMILTESVVPSEVFLAHASFSTGEVFQSLLWDLDDVEQFISSCVEGFDVEIDLSIYEPLELNKSIVKEYSYGDFKVTVSVSVTHLFGF